MLVYLLALGAAVLFAGGIVTQQHAAAQAPPEDVMSVRLLWWLVRRRLWLLGVLASLFGNLLSASALGRGGVALVEPLLLLRLLFALPLAAAWQRCRVPGRDWLGAVATVVGLVIFVAAGDPSQPSPEGAAGSSWAVAAGVVVVLAVLLAAAGRRQDATRQAPMLAGAAGLLFALQDALTSTAVHLVHDPAHLLSTWYPYAVVVVALGATLLVQSAYELAPLPSSLPAQVIAEPVCGIALGVGLLGGSIRLTALPVIGELAGLAGMLGGVFLLARSPLVTGQRLRLRQRQEVGDAYHVQRRLAATLDALQRDLAHGAPGAGAPDGLLPRTRRRLHRELADLRREQGQLRTLLSDLDQLSRQRDDAGLAPATTQRLVVAGSQLAGADTTLEEEERLRSQAERLDERASSLCQDAEQLLAAGG